MKLRKPGEPLPALIGRECPEDAQVALHGSALCRKRVVVLDELSQNTGQERERRPLQDGKILQGKRLRLRRVLRKLRGRELRRQHS